jgi:WD40 repeat protein
MARVRQIRIALALIGLAGTALPARGQPLPPGFHHSPVLVVDPGRHTSRLWHADVDAAGRLAATASDDKTVRIWSLADGRLLRTIPLPAGPGDTGKARAVALDPAGEVVAVGGWTTPPEEPKVIYFYAPATGALLHRIDGLPDVVNHLAFSPDGRRLAAVMQTGGLRVFDRDRGWAEVARDEAYANWSFGAAFAPDGRLATAGFDGLVRLYGSDLELRAKVQAPGGARPFDVAFGPGGARLAVGYFDTTRVDVLDGRDLAPLHAAATEGIDNGNLSRVAWANDGTLLAGGRYVDFRALTVPVLAWEAEGRGPRRHLPVGLDTVNSLRPLPGGDVLVAATGSTLARLTPEGRTAWSLPPLLTSFDGQHDTLAISSDGGVVDFNYGLFDHRRARFDVARLDLMAWPGAPGSPPSDRRTAPARGPSLQSWLETMRRSLGGRPLPLPPFEFPSSLAAHPDGRRFILGSQWSLRAFDAGGTPLWRQAAPGATFALNVASDGRLVVAAYSDGTIRWHRMDDGREILAFMPLTDGQNWLAWTPEGIYAASPGAHGLLRWHVNQPGWQPVISRAVSDIPGFFRPAVIPLVLQELETPRAIGLATLAELRERVQVATSSALAPGARLHTLTIGVSRYDVRHAAHLHLDFAHQDARDLAELLGSTQDWLYAAGGSRQHLADEEATRSAIRRALETLRSAAATPDDLAVVHFSGHGAMVDGQLYLLPHDVDASDPVSIKDTALPVAVLREELARVSERGGRVLLLLDACFSGGAVLAGGATPVDSRRLAGELAAGSVSVLTSSTDSQASREDPAWRHGAFTEAVLEALGRAADSNNDGLLSATELTAYVERRVRALTDARQTPAIEIRSAGTLFAVR